MIFLSLKAQIALMKNHKVFVERECAYMSETEKSSKICIVNIEAEKIGELAHDVYKDLAQPAVKTTGKILNLGARGILARLKPFEKYIMESEYSTRETSILLEKKLENISEEKIVAPPSYIAVPALQAISYSADSQALRELFANLLATSMNVDTRTNAHPAFIEIIKQLSPMEAKILKETKLLSISTPSCTVRFQRNPKTPTPATIQQSEEKNPIFETISEGWTALDHLVLFDNDIIDIDTSCNLLSAFIENFMRLGLCYIPTSRIFPNEKTYEALANHPDLPDIKAFWSNKVEKNKEKDFSLYLIKELIAPTDFGLLFYKACIN
jgi:hypothetical protein